MSDAQFACDAGFVQRDLTGLKRLLEKSRLHPARATIVAAMFLAFATPCLIHPQSTNEGSRREIPVLQSTCLISADVRRLVEFYEPILNRKANWSGRITPNSPRERGCGQFSPPQPRRSTSPAQPNRQRIAASFWNSKSQTYMPDTSVFSRW